jgi:hypothetical protein
VIIDFTIAYRHIKKGLQYPPNLLQVHSLPIITPPWYFHVHVRRYPIEDLPSDEEKLAEWVKQVFVEKDAILEDMKIKWTKCEQLGEIRTEKYF